MACHFNDYEIFFCRNNPGIILTDHRLQARVQAANGQFVQRQFLINHFIVQIIKCFDLNYDLFYLIIEQDYLLLCGSYFYHDPLNAPFAAFRGCQAVYIYASPGKYQCNPTKDPNKVFGKNRNGISLHMYVRFSFDPGLLGSRERVRSDGNLVGVWTGQSPPVWIWFLAQPDFIYRAA